MKKFPFTAILGQDGMKNALLWNVVNPRIGGALFSGQKGTAKSTLVRALAQTLGEGGVVDLPLNMTEDRLVGSIDIQMAIRTGKRGFEPGILYRAHGKILYIDEVNLLGDHIVNSLLEAAASGVNRVEREGISFSHPSEFVLVGSMNPEEGKLRPQFLDRFGLYVEVEGCTQITQRMEITRRRLEYERDPEGFCARWQGEEEALRRRIRRAREALSRTEVTDNARTLAATLSAEACCAGQRAELVIVETARAIAAMDGRTVLNAEDIRTAARYALPHRMRRGDTPPVPEDPPPEDEPPEEQPPAEEEREPETSETQPDDAPGGQEPPSPEGSPGEGGPTSEPPEAEPDDRELPPPRDDAPETTDEVGAAFAVRPWLQNDAARTVRMGSGRRSLVRTSARQGRYVKAVLPHGNEIGDIAFDATLRAAAPCQRFRDKGGMALAVSPEDVRVKVREKRTGNAILFVVDASGSMGANQRMKAVKGAVCSLLNDAYQKRDKVGMIAFRKQSAELLLGITRSVELAQKQLETLPTGGRTPLGAGLELARQVLYGAKVRDKDILPVMVLVTDGRANASEGVRKPVEEAVELARRIGESGVKCIVIDTEKDFIRLRLAEKLAEAMGADYFRIEELNAELLAGVVSLAANK